MPESESLKGVRYFADRMVGMNMPRVAVKYYSGGCEIYLHMAWLREVISLAEGSARYQDALQRAATALGLTAGADTTRDLVPAILKLVYERNSAKAHQDDLQRQFNEAIDQRDHHLRERDTHFNTMKRACEAMGGGTEGPELAQQIECMKRSMNDLASTVRSQIDTMNVLREVLDIEGHEVVSAVKALKSQAVMQSQVHAWHVAGSQAFHDQTANPHPPNSLAGMVHCWGWVQRDLRTALDREQSSRRAAQAELAAMREHCAKIEAENQRYRGSTLDAKASHERREQLDEAAKCVKMSDRVIMDGWATKAPEWAHFVFMNPNGDVFATNASHIVAGSTGWGFSGDILKLKLELLGTDKTGLQARHHETLTAAPAKPAADAQYSVTEDDLAGFVKLAPAWATRIAVDKNGEVWAYEGEPRQFDDSWGSMSRELGAERIGDIGCTISNWQLTERLARHSSPSICKGVQTIIAGLSLDADDHADDLAGICIVLHQDC